MAGFRNIAKIIIFVIVMLLGDKYRMYSYNVHTPDMNHIIDNIYLGNWADSTNWHQLEQDGITHILTLNKKMSHTEKQLDEMKSNDIDNMFIYVEDDTESEISQYFDKCISFIKDADNVLVHCSAGISRSVTIVIAYMVREKNMSVNDALAFIRTKRPRANPNCGFISQLTLL
jgi:protein-tyrosine phosphatase